MEAWKIEEIRRMQEGREDASEKGFEEIQPAIGDEQDEQKEEKEGEDEPKRGVADITPGDINEGSLI